MSIIMPQIGCIIDETKMNRIKLLLKMADNFTMIAWEVFQDN